MKRLLTYIVLFCVMFTMTGCSENALHTDMNTAATSSAETVAEFKMLTWKVKTVDGKLTSDKGYKSLLHIMDYETTIEAVNSLFAERPNSYRLKYFQYKRDYYNENSLFIIEYESAESGEISVTEVSTDGSTLRIICEKPVPKAGSASIGVIYRRCYFLEVYDYIPASEEDIVFEVSYPKL